MDEVEWEYSQQILFYSSFLVVASSHSRLLPRNKMISSKLYLAPIKFASSPYIDAYDSSPFLIACWIYMRISRIFIIDEGRWKDAQDFLRRPTSLNLVEIDPSNTPHNGTDMNIVIRLHAYSQKSEGHIMP